MASPFTVFRKNQKIMTVVLIGLSMFAFVILGTIQAGQGGSEENLPAVFGLLLGGILFWWVGKGTKHVWTLTTIGCILGIIIGSYYRGISPANAAFKSKAGNLTSNDLMDLRKQRDIANGFAIEAFITASGFRLPPQTVAQFMPRLTGEQLFGFGSPDENEDVALGFLLRTKAREMGMMVSDDQVQAFINRVSQEKLSKEDYLDILKRFRVTHEQMYGILKSELLARQAMFTMIPRDSVTPGNLWDLYKKVNLKQQMDVISIPVEPFISMVSEPSESELKDLFNAHKDVLPDEEGPGTPGFFQPDKIKVAYLEADYETIEKSVEQPTEEEIKAYFEANKQKYVVNPFPKDEEKKDSSDDTKIDESEKKEDASNSEMKKEDGNKEESKKEDDKKTEKSDAKKTEVKKSDKQKTKTPKKDAPKEEKKTADKKEESKSEKPKASEKAADSSEKKPEPKKEESPKKESEGKKSDDKKTGSLLKSLDSSLAKSPSSRMTGLFQVALLDEEPKDKETKTADKKTSDVKKEAPKKTTEKPGKKEVAEKKTEKKEEKKPAEKKPAKSEKKVEPKEKKESAKKESEKKEETKADSKKSSDEMKKETEEEEKPAKPQFRPLDEDLKSEISDAILQERTFAKLNEKIDDALSFMLSLGLDQARSKDDPAKLTAEQVNTKLKKYAEENKLRYVETPWLSQEEFVASEEYRFKDWISVNSKGATEDENSVSAESQHFDTGIDRLFSPMYSQDAVIGNRFAHWKIGYKEAHVPAFEDEGIKEQVEEEWKFIEARKLAQKRADELVEKIKNAPEDKILKDVLEGETETGEKDSNTVLINGTPPTPWYTISRSSVPTNPNAPPPPPQIRLSGIGMLDSGVSEEIMETAFNKLEVGGVGSALDLPKENVVIVKVISRQDEAEVQQSFKDAGKSILSDPVFGQLVSRQQRSTQVKWLQDFKDDLQFTMVEQPEPEEL